MAAPVSDSAIPLSEEELKSIIASAAASVGFDLKPQQEESLLQFSKGKDVFVSLPTGFGKSLCYTLLPLVFDLIRVVEKKSIALVISPLIALMEDQVATIKSMKISAVYISDKKLTDHAEKQKVLNGEYQLIFMSPEALFSTLVWRQMFCTDHYQSNLIAFVVDEAHCIKKWGSSFRKDFSYLNEVRSIVPQNVALTATTTLATRKFIIQNLGMQAPAVVYVPPVKNNIIYYVFDKPDGGVQRAFQPIAKALLREKVNMERMLIFCYSYESVISVHHFFKTFLGKHFVHPIGSPDYVNYRVVDVFTHCTHSTVRRKIIKQFTTPSQLRVVIATIAFGMGINCPDIRQVVHWGVPEDAEAYIQESGRAGRDEKPCLAVIMKTARDMDKRRTSEQIREYCAAKSCRRSILFRDFAACEFKTRGNLCMCCDICKISCQCGECDKHLGSFHFPNLIIVNNNHCK